MAETLDTLVSHLDAQRSGRRARIVVWEHNSHLGDARATEMSTAGELNVGQLVRERYARDAVLVGFTDDGRRRRNVPERPVNGAAPRAEGTRCALLPGTKKDC